MPLQPATFVAAKTLLVHENRALILRRSESDPAFPGSWELPGGKLEYGETPEETALRELLEETGITGTLGPLLCADSIVSERTQHQYIVLFYLAHAKTAHVTLSFEHADSLWATKGQMREMLSHSQLAAFNRYCLWDVPGFDVEEG